MIRLAQSVVGEEEADAVARVILDDGYLGMGREVGLFESELAEYLRVERDSLICVNSGTAALHLALESVLEPGDEVLVQSLTFVATFQAIKAAGCIPISCEVLADTVTIDLNDARKRLTSRTKAIVPVHYASNPGDLAAIYQFAKEHRLRVIEDAAHAFGCSYHEKLIGAQGDLVCFSFDGIKNISSGEGGAVVAHRAVDASRIRDARLLGVEKDTDNRLAGRRSWDFDVKNQGYRYHLSNVLAAIGRVQLRRFDKEFRPKRLALVQRYTARLKSIPSVTLVASNSTEIVPHIFPVRILNGKRDLARNRLTELAIETGIHYKPNHLLSYFKQADAHFPATEALYAELLSLPLHPKLSLEDVDQVCDSLIEVL